MDKYDEVASWSGSSSSITWAIESSKVLPSTPYRSNIGLRSFEQDTETGANDFFQQKKILKPAKNFKNFAKIKSKINFFR